MWCFPILENLFILITIEEKTQGIVFFNALNLCIFDNFCKKFEPNSILYQDFISIFMKSVKVSSKSDSIPYIYQSGVEFKWILNMFLRGLGMMILPSQKKIQFVFLLYVCFMDITLTELGSQRRNPKEIPKSSPASLRKTLSFPNLLLRFTFYV